MDRGSFLHPQQGSDNRCVAPRPNRLIAIVLVLINRHFFSGCPEQAGFGLNRASAGDWYEVVVSRMRAVAAASVWFTADCFRSSPEEATANWLERARPLHYPSVFAALPVLVELLPRNGLDAEPSFILLPWLESARLASRAASICS